MAAAKVFLEWILGGLEMFVKGHRYKNTKSSVPKFPDSAEISAESAEACDTSSIRRILSQNLASDSKSEARPDSIVNIG